MDILRLHSREPCVISVIKRGPHQIAPQKSEGFAFRSLVRLTRDLQGVLPFGVVSDGSYRGTGLHVFVESRSIEEAPRETTSTDKLEVEVLPHVAEGCVGVLINNSTVQTEGELPASSFKIE